MHNQVLSHYTLLHYTYIITIKEKVKLNTGQPVLKSHNTLPPELGYTYIFWLFSFCLKQKRLVGVLFHMPPSVSRCLARSQQHLGRQGRHLLMLSVIFTVYSYTDTAESVCIILIAINIIKRLKTYISKTYHPPCQSMSITIYPQFNKKQILFKRKKKNLTDIIATYYKHSTNGFRELSVLCSCT